MQVGRRPHPIRAAFPSKPPQRDTPGCNPELCPECHSLSTQLSADNRVNTISAPSFRPVFSGQERMKLSCDHCQGSAETAPISFFFAAEVKKNFLRNQGGSLALSGWGHCPNKPQTFAEDALRNTQVRTAPIQPLFTVSLVAGVPGVGDLNGRTLCVFRTALR